MLLKICKKDNMIFACPNHLFALFALFCAFLPHIRKNNKTTNRPINIDTKGIAAIPIDAPSRQEMQSVPCFTNSAAHTRQSDPEYPLLHCSSVCEKVVLLLLFLTQMDMLDAASATGQQRAFAKSLAFNALYPAAHGEKTSLSKLGLQYPGSAVSSAKVSPSLAEQSAPTGQGRQLPSITPV